MKNVVGNNVPQGSQNKLLDRILKAIKDVRYGSVVITIHDSKVVQIDKTEKMRFDGQNAWDYEI